MTRSFAQVLLVRIIHPVSNGSKVMAKVKNFRYAGQQTSSKSLDQNFGMNGIKEGLITRNVQVKYDSSTWNGKG